MRSFHLLETDEIRAGSGQESSEFHNSAITLDTFLEDLEVNDQQLEQQNRPKYRKLKEAQPISSRVNRPSDVSALGESLHSNHPGTGLSHPSPTPPKPNQTTYAYQDDLPRLPIPSLAETANIFIQFLEALMSPREFMQAHNEIFDFLKGDGCVLQSLLEEYEESGFREGVLGSYIEEFWKESNPFEPEHDADEEGSPSISGMQNPFFLLPPSPDPEHGKDPLHRAASLSLAAIKLAHSIQNENLMPDIFRGKPLCMGQYKAVFGTARVPNLETKKDGIDVYPQSTHVVVLCRNQIYYFQAMWPDTSDVAIDEQDLMDILTVINQNSKRSARQKSQELQANVSLIDDFDCLGACTALSRNQWGEIRLELCESDPLNSQYLTIIDSALFVLALDLEYSPGSVKEAAAHMLHGTMSQPPAIDGLANSPLHQIKSYQNRWYDKFQIIVCGDGTAGVNFEQNAIDGHTALRIVSDIYAETVVNFARSVAQTVPSRFSIPPIIDARTERLLPNHPQDLDIMPKKLSFVIPKKLQGRLVKVDEDMQAVISSSDIQILEFKEFGKKFCITNNVSPDAFVQMGIVLTYFKLTGEMTCVYEPVLTKYFHHGRNEAMHSVTIAAKVLCESFFNSDVRAIEKLTALRRAIQVHVKLVEQCADGKGADRHLYALKCIAQRNDLPVPKFFNSKAWHILGCAEVATANCGNPALCHHGFGPTSAGGYGIGYIIKDNSIHFTVSSSEEQAQPFVMALHSVLTQMEVLFRRTPLGSRTNSWNSRNSRGSRARRRQRRAAAASPHHAHPRQEGPSNGDTSSVTTDLSFDPWNSGRPTSETEDATNPHPSRTLGNEMPLYADQMASGDLLGGDSQFSFGYSGDKPPASGGTGDKPPMIPPHKSDHSFRFPSSSKSMAATAETPLMSGGRKGRAEDFQPTIPKRCDSLFGMRRKESLTLEQLSQSGVTWDYDQEDSSSEEEGTIY